PLGGGEVDVEIGAREVDPDDAVAAALEELLRGLADPGGGSGDDVGAHLRFPLRRRLHRRHFEARNAASGRVGPSVPEAAENPSAPGCRFGHTEQTRPRAPDRQGGDMTTERLMPAIDDGTLAPLVERVLAARPTSVDELDDLAEAIGWDAAAARDALVALG